LHKFFDMKNDESMESPFDGIDFSLFSEEEPIKDVKEELVVDTVDDEDEDDDIIETSPSDESDDTNNGSSSSSYQVLAKALSEEGVFSISEEALKDVNGADQIIDLVQGEINARVEEYKKSLPKEVKELLDGYDDGADFDELLKVKKEQITFSKIKEEDLDDNEELMRKVLAKDLELRGMDQEDIQEEIDDIFALGKEDLRSKKALKNILRATEAETTRLREEAKKEEASRLKEYNDRMTTIRKSVDSTNEIGGVPVSKKIQDTAYKAITTPVAEYNGTPINALTKSRLEDPVEFDKTVAILWALTDGFKKYDAFGKAAKKRALTELDQVADKLAREKALGTQPNRKSYGVEETVLSGIDLNSIK